MTGSVIDLVTFFREGAIEGVVEFLAIMFIFVMVNLVDLIFLMVIFCQLITVGFV